MSMVEKVALVLAQEQRHTGSLKWNKPAPRHYAQARAAIEAMREPTEAMVEAAVFRASYATTEERWRAMIDKALSE